MRTLLRAILAIILATIGGRYYGIILSIARWLLYILFLPFTITFTFRFDGLRILVIVITLGVVCYFLLHYFVFNRYSRLKSVPSRVPLDLPPEPAVEEPTPSDLLSKIKIFGYLEPEVYADLVRAVEEKVVEAGENIRTKGHFYMVAEGMFELRVRKPILESTDEETELTLSEVRAGRMLSSLFDILSVLTRIESLDTDLEGRFRVKKVAITKSRLLVIPEEAFSAIADKYPRVAAHIVQIIMSRFHRVTFMTLQRYLGLSREALYIIKAFNQKIPTMNLDIMGLLDFSSNHGSSSNATKSNNRLDDLMTSLSRKNREFIQKSVWEHVMEFLKVNDHFDSSVWESISLRIVSANSHIVLQGERNPDLFVLIYGEFVASCESQGVKQEFVLSKPGSIIGAIASIFGHYSFVTMSAKTDCLVAILRKASLDFIAEKCPEILITISRRLLHCISPLVKVIDTAVEWNHLDAGQTLCYQNDPAENIHIILHGRVRVVHDAELVAEYGAGESLGELEMLIGSTWPGTVRAVRDTEIASMPRHIFNCLAQFYPEISLNISRILAMKSRSIERGGSIFRANPLNLRTVAIVPVSPSMQNLAIDFALRLREELSSMEPTLLLDTTIVGDVLGKQAFRAIGKLKLLEWLHSTEEEHRLVLYLADTVQSLWTQRCIRQADCIMFVAHAAADPSIGAYERLVFGSMARKELVLIHDSVNCVSGLSRQWLDHRLWISTHHHVTITLFL